MKSNISKRKTDHLRLAANAQLQKRDRNFSDYDLTYEPCLGIFPADNFNLKQTIGHKSIDHPLWISSMTGGSAESGKINKILAKIAHEWGLGMGLGSCRILMDNPKNIKDFQLRPILKDRPLWANLGICQVDEFNRQNNWKKFQRILEDLDVDGLMIHINPTQEFLQKEGSTLKHSAIDILTSFLVKMYHYQL